MGARSLVLLFDSRATGIRRTLLHLLHQLHLLYYWEHETKYNRYHDGTA